MKAGGVAWVVALALALALTEGGGRASGEGERVMAVDGHKWQGELSNDLNINITTQSIKT